MEPDSGGGTFGTNTNVIGNQPGTNNPISGTAHFFLLPYIEAGNIYTTANGAASNVATQQVKNFICPSDPSLSSNINRDGYASTNYAGNLEVFNPKGPGTLLTSMPDGLSNTVIFAERYKNCSPPVEQGVTMPGWGVHPAYVGHGWDTPAFGWHDAGGGYDPDFEQNQNPGARPASPSRSPPP